MKQLLLDIKPAAPPTLLNFIAGRNDEALASLNAVASNSAQSKFIYLWGEAGSGKSHLLSACEAIGMQVVDNVHLLNNDAQIDLFNIYNQLKESGGTLITAGLHAPTQMGLRDDLATRLAWGLVYQLHPLNDAEKALALQNHAAERGIRLPTEVVDYCLRYLRRDLSTLMATLDALDEWSLTTKKPVTVPLLRQLLQLNLEA
ncbi:HdaA/DnaA family protein [Methylotenera versatilis]|uniref:DnaA regulatory inactivator Hda n=1 Tax=Methylotenera versatilis (strain 301) TaxID=666681 RepID=D7DL25_METV0|nr:DnaA/Hda family protein [Methylotenera versatilis]ADI28636.1 DnaA regulatory inactivator Hda [Methylotenera versatilis 301]